MAIAAILTAQPAWRGPLNLIGVTRPELRWVFTKPPSPE
jgi:hypothetical protein